jgi:hypothetical protein
MRDRNWEKLYGLFKSRCGLPVITLGKVCTASSCVVLRIFGSDLDHPIIISNRPVGFLDMFVGSSFIIKCARATRIGLDCFAIIGDRFVEFADVSVESAAVVISVSIFWVQLDCRSRVANCQFILALVSVENGTVIIGARVFRIAE